jgi:hypothetical protein
VKGGSDATCTYVQTRLSAMAWVHCNYTSFPIERRSKASKNPFQLLDANAIRGTTYTVSKTTMSPIVSFKSRIFVSATEKWGQGGRGNDGEGGMTMEACV